MQNELPNSSWCVCSPNSIFEQARNMATSWSSFGTLPILFIDISSAFLNLQGLANASGLIGTSKGPRQDKRLQPHELTWTCENL